MSNEPEIEDFTPSVMIEERGGPAPLLQSDHVREIRALEDAQARPLRELALATTPEAQAAAKQRLADIESQIAVFRAKVQALDAVGTNTPPPS